MNKVILMGRLTRDPEIRYSSSTEPVAVTKFTLAVNRPFSNNQEQKADFIPVVAFGKRAETIANYVKKGQMISIVGRMQTQKYQNPDTAETRTYTDVVLEDFYFAESKQSGQAPTGPKPPEEPNYFIPAEEDPDLPF